jgi:hypothetical protein
MLDPRIGNLMDSNQTSVKKRNWNIFRREIKKFGIDMHVEVLHRILHGDTR